MKSIWLLPFTALLIGCIYTDKDIVENREVIVTPPNAHPAFLTRGSSIDVTTTQIVGARKVQIETGD